MEKELVPVVDKAFRGDRIGAVESATAVLIGLLTGHPILGRLGGNALAILARALAGGVVDGATQRLLTAANEAEREEQDAKRLRARIVDAIQPLLGQQDEAVDEHFLQTLRFIERNVASSSSAEEILKELRTLRNDIDAKTSQVATCASGIEVAAGPRSQKALRGRIMQRFAPDEFEVFVRDNFPDIGGLERVVSPLRGFEYQVFKFLEYCERKQRLEHLRRALARELGVPVESVG